MRQLVFILVIAGILITSASCVSDPVSMMGCHFRIESTSDFHLAGIDLSDLEELDVNQTETVTAALESGDCQVAFVVNIAARNPDNTGDVTIQDFDWDALVVAQGLYKYACSGGITSSVTLGDDETLLIPGALSFDAADMLYPDISAEGIIEMCLALGGKNRNLRDSDHLGRLTLEVTLAEDTPLGLILVVEPVTVGLDWVQPE